MDNYNDVDDGYIGDSLSWRQLWNVVDQFELLVTDSLHWVTNMAKNVTNIFK